MRKTGKANSEPDLERRVEPSTRLIDSPMPTPRLDEDADTASYVASLLSACVAARRNRPAGSRSLNRTGAGAEGPSKKVECLLGKARRHFRAFRLSHAELSGGFG
jgi:hypothetical protein